MRGCQQKAPLRCRWQTPGGALGIDKIETGTFVDLYEGGEKNQITHIQIGCKNIRLYRSEFTVWVPSKKNTSWVVLWVFNWADIHE